MPALVRMASSRALNASIAATAAAFLGGDSRVSGALSSDRSAAGETVSPAVVWGGGGWRVGWGGVVDFVNT